MKDLPKVDRPSLPRRVAKRLLRGEKLDPPAPRPRRAGKYGPEHLLDSELLAVKVKGNCDTDLVLKAAVDYFERNFTKAVLVSSDGDYACLVQFLKERSVVRSLVSPSNKCSFLLRKLNVPLVYLDTQKNTLKYEP